VAERLTCPRCGQGPVLAPASVLAVVLDAPHAVGEVWGKPTSVLLSDDARAECNVSACGWTGTVAEARGLV
jgi:hypothetical protein